MNKSNEKNNKPSTTRRRKNTPRSSDRGTSNKVTIKVIAKRLGIAHSTVSRALNDGGHISEETKRRVRKVADELGYIVDSSARTMRTAKGSTIGLIVPSFVNEFFSTVAEEVAEACSTRKLQLIYSTMRDDAAIEFQRVNAMLEMRVAGIIICPTPNIHRDTIRMLEGVPVIQFVRQSTDLKSDFIGVDDKGGIYKATRHLLELGHRRVAFVGGQESLVTAQHRYAGYCHALQEAGVNADRMPAYFGPPHSHFGAEALRQLMSSDRNVTAVVVTTLQQTIGLFIEARETGVRVPDDISVVGFGNPAWFKLVDPPIDVIDHPARELSSTIISLLFQRIEDADKEPMRIEHRNVRISTELIVRGSSRSAKAKKIGSTRIRES